MATSNYLKAQNFGFNIPTDEIINGILVEIERNSNASNAVKDTNVKIVKADGTIGTTNKADTSIFWPTTDTYKSYGGSSDLWGETWTYANINDADFGVVLNVEGTSGVARVDHIRITITYGAVAGYSEPQTQVIILD